VIVGGKGGPKILRHVAEAADGWNTVWRWTPENYGERVGDLERACERVGRDPGSVKRSVGVYTIVGSDGNDFETRWRATCEGAPIDTSSLNADDYMRDGLAGPADHCIERIKAFEALGAEEMICTFGLVPFMVSDMEQVELFAREVLPAVR